MPTRNLHGGGSAREPQPLDLGQLTNQVSGLVRKGSLRDALALAESARALAAREPASYDLWLAGVRCSAGRLDEAVRGIEDALARGAWWHPRLVAEHPELAALAGHPRRRELVEHSRARWQVAQAFAERAEPVVRRPQGSPRAVVVALHGVTGLARPFAAMWMRAVVATGCALVVLQSPVMTNSDGRFGWLLERADPGVVEAYRAVAAAEGLEGLPVIVAGFSQGGGLAADLSLSGALSSVGFVAVGPDAIAATPAVVRDAAARGVRGSLLVGEWDWARDDAERFFWNRLGPGGVESSFEIMPAVGHAVSRDFGRRLAAALRFVLRD